MSKTISIETARGYLIQHVGALRKQLPYGDPFVFLGAFSLISTVSKATNRPMFVAEDMELGITINNLIRKQSQKFFESFSLVPVPEEKNQSWAMRLVNCGEVPPVDPGAGATKLNLSHKDRQHLKVKDGYVTLAAPAFLDDLEKGINSAFDRLTELDAHKMYVYFNTDNQLVGYGD